MRLGDTSLSEGGTVHEAEGQQPITGHTHYIISNFGTLDYVFLDWGQPTLEV